MFDDDSEPPDIDITVAHPARMYDYYLGGKNHFAADREAADRVLAVLPEGREMAIANRTFLGRAVRFLAAEGIDQFLDIGTAIPSPGSTGEVLQQIGHDARVVYVDNDPIVVAHTRALLAGGGQASVVHADLRDPAALLASPAVRHVLDFSRPVAVLLVAAIHFIRDSEDPDRIVGTLKAAMSPRSYLAVSQGTADFNTERASAAVRGYDEATAPFVLRSKDRIQRFFDGLDLIDPGVVQLPFWRPDGSIEGDPSKVWLYAGADYKPCEIIVHDW